jgi:hypothetical protein
MTESIAHSIFGYEPSPPTSLSGWEQLGRSVVSRRVDRLSVLRGDNRSSIKSAPTHLDASLLTERRALDDAWARELNALIRMKRAPTPEAIAAAEAAHTATGRIVTRIEMAKAMTFDGLKVQARAALWRRRGEPVPGENSPYFLAGRPGSTPLCEA